MKQTRYLLVFLLLFNSLRSIFLLFNKIFCFFLCIFIDSICICGRLIDDDLFIVEIKSVFKEQLTIFSHQVPLDLITIFFLTFCYKFYSYIAIFISRYTLIKWAFDNCRNLFFKLWKIIL